METKLMKIVAVLFLFSVCNSGTAQDCSLRSLYVTQSEIQMIRYEMVYQVTVLNHCRCKQSNIKLTCSGFSFDNGVDPAVVMPQGDGQCLLVNGEAVKMGPGNAITFRYASKSRIDFVPVSSTIDCSREFE